MSITSKAMRKHAHSRIHDFRLCLDELNENPLVSTKCLQTLRHQMAHAINTDTPIRPIMENMQLICKPAVIIREPGIYNFLVTAAGTKVPRTKFGQTRNIIDICNSSSRTIFIRSHIHKLLVFVAAHLHHRNGSYNMVLGQANSPEGQANSFEARRVKLVGTLAVITPTDDIHFVSPPRWRYRSISCLISYENLQALPGEFMRNSNQCPCCEGFKTSQRYACFECEALFDRNMTKVMFYSRSLVRKAYALKSSLLRRRNHLSPYPRPHPLPQ